MKLLPFSALVCLLCALLLPNHYLPWLAAYSEFLVFLSVLLLGFFFACYSVPLPRSVIFLLLCLVIPILQWSFGAIIFFGDAFIASSYLFAFACAVMIGNAIAINPIIKQVSINYFAATILVAAVVSAWIALRQWLLLSGSIWVVDLPPGGRPFANLGQPNHLATLLSLGLAAVLYFYEKRYLGRIAGAFLTFFLLVGLALTQSRTPWVGAICGLIWWVWQGRRIPLRLSWKLYVGWLLVYVIVLVSLPSIVEFLGLAPGADLLDRAQAAHRLDIWRQMLSAVVQGPLWGYGWTQVSMAQIAVALQHPIFMRMDNSHNIVLDLILWNGPLLGGLIVVTNGLWLTRIALRTRTLEGTLALLAAGFVLVHGMFEYPLEYAYFLLPVGLLLGLAEGEAFTCRKKIVHRWLLMGTLVIFAGLLSWVWYEYRIIEEEHRLMRFERSNLGGPIEPNVISEVILLTQLKEHILFARTIPLKGMDRTRLEWMQSIAHRYPYPYNLYKSSLALSLNGYPDLAAKEIFLIRVLHGERSYNWAKRELELEVAMHPEIEETLRLIE